MHYLVLFNIFRKENNIFLHFSHKAPFFVASFEIFPQFLFFFFRNFLLFFCIFPQLPNDSYPDLTQR